ncbi:MAG TPA: response regulator [Nitrososphaeraceae archaeon]|jgi:DNA-binding response OmpR family regulator
MTTFEGNLSNTDKRGSILVVDDEPDIVITLRTVLERNNFKVDTHTEPLQVIKNFEINAYDLLILDIKMPQMNGFELYRELKKIDENIKVCFLTALSELHDYDAFKKEVFPKTGQRYYVQKPIENDEILERINEILGSS